VMKMLPLAEEAAEPLDLFIREFPEVFLRRGEDKSLLALFNWTDRAKKMKLELRKLGLSGPHHVFEFWSKKYMGVTDNSMDLGMVPPHACRYMALTPAGDQKKPVLVGLDFHLGMGTQGFEKLEVGPEGRMNIQMSLPGKRKGKAWVVTAEGEVREIEMEFK